MDPSASSSDSFFEHFGFPRLFLLVLSLAFLQLSVQVGLGAIFAQPLLSSALASLSVLILLPLGFVRSVGASPREALLLRGIGFREVLLLTVLTLATAFPVDLLTAWNLQLIPAPEGLAESMAELRPQTPWGWALAALVLAGIGPIGEELVFRGLLLRGAERVMGPRQALFLSSALFAAAHLQAYFVAGLFVVGLVLGIVFQRTRSLPAAILVHGLYNLLSLASWSTNPEEEAGWTDGALGLPLALAGAAIAWWVLRHLPQRKEPGPTSTIGRWSDPD